ncbi:MAG TPA: hypothetical protein VME69_06275 [Methylocella sp.]|nr:hypothetical protein [Methylocella sp.]
MGALDLVSLADLQGWIGAAGNPATLAALISQTSQAVLNGLYRSSVLPHSYTEYYDGNGGERFFLRNWPVIDVFSLSINGQAIPASSPWGAGQSWQKGYMIAAANNPTPPGMQQDIILRGYRFRRGVQNIAVSYSAGYQISGEVQSIPATSPYQVTALAPYGAWASDEGVLIEGSLASSVIGAPSSAGQYSVAAGLYAFAAADAGKPVTISYGYIPADLGLACLQIAGEYFAYQSHPGVQSKSLGGQETIAYNASVLTSMVARNGLLNPYRRVVPL